MLAWIVGILFLTLTISSYFIYKMVFKPIEINKPFYVHIDKNTRFEELLSEVKKEARLPSEKIFRILANRMNYTTNMKTGRYAVKKGDNMPRLIRRLRSGVQEPVNITFNNIRTKEIFAGRISHQLMLDSIALLTALNDPSVANEFGFNTHTFLSMFIPNTYQIYWDTSVQQFLKRMEREYNTFWNASRKAKAQQIDLSPVEVSILASVVEEEAMYSDEYPTIAGLYLNRLKKGMRLEADPTIKFALGNPALRRILLEHLEVDSPYNTYKTNGLPPGPIRIPSIKAIDGTLSAASHHYIFMCAKDDLSGRHNFATTHAEHSRNARRYHQALNARGIY